MKKLGKAFIKVDGRVLRSRPGARLNIGGVQRTTRSDVTGFGYSEEDMQSMLTADLDYDGQTSLAEIRKWDNVTVSFETDTGQSYIITGGWVTETIELTDGNSSGYSITIEGPPAEEMK